MYVDSNIDTTPALRAGSAVRANPLHTQYIEYRLRKWQFKKQNEITPTPSQPAKAAKGGKKIKKVNIHSPIRYIYRYIDVSIYLYIDILFLHHCTKGGRVEGEMARADISAGVERRHNNATYYSMRAPDRQLQGANRLSYTMSQIHWEQEDHIHIFAAK